MNSKCVEQRCGKREIRKTDYDVALQVGEKPMSAETWLAGSMVIGQWGMVGGLYAMPCSMHCVNICVMLCTAIGYLHPGAGIKRAAAILSGIRCQMKKGWCQGLGQYFGFPSVLWHCWFFSRKGNLPIKTVPLVPQKFSLWTSGGKKAKEELADTGSPGRCWLQQRWCDVVLYGRPMK